MLGRNASAFGKKLQSTVKNDFEELYWSLLEMKVFKIAA